MFAATELNHRNQKIQKGWQILFLLMTALLILPVLVILGTLVVKGGGDALHRLPVYRSG